MGKSNPVLVTVAAAAWYLGGIAFVLLLSGVSDKIHPFRYMIIGTGTLIMALPAVWLRSPAVLVFRMRREEFVGRVYRLVLFAAGVLSILAVGIMDIAEDIATCISAFSIFLAYFVLGVYALSAMLARARHDFYSTRCPRCLYDLTAVESATCPECGLAITPPQTEATQAPRR